MAEDPKRGGGPDRFAKNEAPAASPPQVSQTEATRICTACQTSKESPGDNDDGLCLGCRSVFHAAKVLFQHGIAAEEELIPTLVFARIAGRAQDPHYEHHYRSGYGHGEEKILSGDHPALEIVMHKDRLPIVRVKPFAVSAERHSGTQILKLVRIRTLSKAKYVKSSDVAKSHEKLLREEGVLWDENSHGTVSYYCLFGYLELVVAEGTELSPNTAEGLGKDLFRHPAFQFPPPRAVKGIHKALQDSFAGALDLYGKANKKTPDKLIPAFAAWHVGGKADEQVPSAERARVSRVLNRHLLEPCGLLQLPENSWSSNDTVWADVRDLLPRFINIQQYAFLSSHRP